MILCFDFGMKYIGIATGQIITRSSTPLTCIAAKDGIPNWDEIANIIAQWKPQSIVVGLPLNMDGTQQQITACAKKFANRMKQKYKLPVYLADERLSTWEAKNQLFSHSTNKASDLRQLNAKSAAIILEQWLSEQ